MGGRRGARIGERERLRDVVRERDEDVEDGRAGVCAVGIGSYLTFIRPEFVAVLL